MSRLPLLLLLLLPFGGRLGLGWAGLAWAWLGLGTGLACWPRLEPDVRN